MLYQASLHLHKVLNQEVPSFEGITVLTNMTCTRRQITFEILRDNNGKIGMNTNFTVWVERSVFNFLTWNLCILKN